MLDERQEDEQQRASYVRFEELLLLLRAEGFSLKLMEHRGRVFHVHSGGSIGDTCRLIAPASAKFSAFLGVSTVSRCMVSIDASAAPGRGPCLCCR